MTKSSQQALPLLSQKTITETEIPEPPQEVLFSWLIGWLKEEYARTGRWPMPPKDGANFSFYQPPMPGLAGPVKVEAQADQGKHHKHSRAARRTGFNYRQSEYWIAAGSLIEEQAARPVAVELRFGCQLVLSLILAWMNFPLFNSGARQGDWMTLGCDRMCKELRVTSRNVLSYMYELERAGLVLPGRVGTGLISRLEFDTLKADIPQLADHLAPDLAGKDVACDYWQARCVQQKSTFYRLKPGISRPSLPSFNPFQPEARAERTEKDLGRTWDGPEKDVQGSFLNDSTSFPGLHDSDHEHDYESEEIKKGLEREMTPDQQERLAFLLAIEKNFKGCRCGPLDQAVAAGLAVQYEMPVLMAALKKVGRDWARNSHIIDSPVALFISELRKNKQFEKKPAKFPKPKSKHTFNQVQQQHLPAPQVVKERSPEEIEANLERLRNLGQELNHRLSGEKKRSWEV